MTSTAADLLVACVEDDPAIVRLLDECLSTAGHTGLFARVDALARRTDPGGRVDGNPRDTDLHRLAGHLNERGPEAEIRTVRGVGHILRGT